jgi:hypothetical protein
VSTCANNLLIKTGHFLIKLTNRYEHHRVSSTLVASLKSEVNARPRDRDARSLHNPQSLVDLFEEAVDAQFVSALGSFEDFEVDAHGFCRTPHFCVVLVLVKKCGANDEKTYIWKALSTDAAIAERYVVLSTAKSKKLSPVAVRLRLPSRTWRCGFPSAHRKELSRAGCLALGLAGQIGDGRLRGDADGLLELGTGSGWFFEFLVGQS